MLDQITKFLVEQFLVLGRPLVIIDSLDFFRLTFITNTGAAWGLMRGYNTFLISVAVIVSVGCIWVIQSNKDTLLRLSASFILGGGLGNMLDRIFFDYGVVDFVDIGIYTYRWPAFNLADTALSLGMIIFILSILEEEVDNFSVLGDESKTSE